MKIIKLILILLSSLIISFGGWYLVGVFLSNEPNMMLWNTFGKILYLFFGFISFAKLFEEFDEE